MAKEKTIENFQVNDTYSFCRTFSQQDFVAFSQLSGDENPLHHDENYAKSTPFAEPIVPLHLVTSPLSAIAGMVFPGHKSLYLSHQLKALNPVPYNLELSYSAKITAIDHANRILTIRTLVFHERQVFIEAEQRIQVRDDVIEGAQINDLHHLGDFVQPSQAILITGAAGELGQSIAYRFASKGYDLIFQVRKNTPEVEDIVTDLQFKHDVKVAIMACDLATCDTGQFNLLLSEFNQKPIAVVHCASPALSDDLANLMAVNYAAMKNLSDALLPLWLRQQNGSLVFVSSSATHFHPEGWQDYCAAKSAGVNFCASFNHRFQAFGVNAKVISPGLISTQFSVDAVADQSNAMLPEQVAEAVVELYESEQTFYSWVEKEMTQQGNFGFFTKQNIISNSERNQSGQNTEYASKSHDGLEQSLQDLLVAHLGLSSATDWSSAGVAITPKWDSLNHMLLLVEIERMFDVSIASMEMSRTTNYPQLLDLLMEKLSN